MQQLTDEMSAALQEMHRKATPKVAPTERMIKAKIMGRKTTLRTLQATLDQLEAWQEANDHDVARACWKSLPKHVRDTAISRLRRPRA